MTQGPGAPAVTVCSPGPPSPSVKRTDRRVEDTGHSRPRGCHPRLQGTAGRPARAALHAPGWPTPAELERTFGKAPRDARDSENPVGNHPQTRSVTGPRAFTLRSDVLLTRRHDGARPQGVLNTETLVNGRVAVVLCTGTKGGQHITRFSSPVSQTSAASRGPQAGRTEQRGEGETW